MCAWSTTTKKNQHIRSRWSIERIIVSMEGGNDLFLVVQFVRRFSKWCARWEMEEIHASESLESSLSFAFLLHSFHWEVGLSRHITNNHAEHYQIMRWMFLFCFQGWVVFVWGRIEWFFSSEVTKTKTKGQKETERERAANTKKNINIYIYRCQNFEATDNNI